MTGLLISACIVAVVSVWALHRSAETREDPPNVVRLEDVRKRRRALDEATKVLRGKR